MSSTVDGPRSSRYSAAADYSAKQFYIVKQSAETVATLASAATDLLLGTIVNKPKSGETVEIFGRQGGGTGLVKLGGTVLLGEYITSDNAGKGVATTTAGDEVIGRALQGGVVGDIIEYSPLNDKFRTVN